MANDENDGKNTPPMHGPLTDIFCEDTSTAVTLGLITGIVASNFMHDNSYLPLREGAVFSVGFGLLACGFAALRDDSSRVIYTGAAGSAGFFAGYMLDQVLRLYI